MNISFFSRPNSHLIIWSRETGSYVPSRVSLLILYTQAESGAYSRDPSRFPRRRHSPFSYTTYILHDVYVLTRSTIGGGGRGCNKFVPVLGGNGTKIAPTGDIFDQPPGEMR